MEDNTAQLAVSVQWFGVAEEELEMASSSRESQMFVKANPE